MSSAKARVTVTTAAARRYRNSSSRSSTRMTARFRITPRSTKIAGHRSRTSSTKGTRSRRETTKPATAAKSVGEEATTTSGRPRTCGVACSTACTMK